MKNFASAVCDRRTSSLTWSEVVSSSKLSNPASTIAFVAANLTIYSCVLGAILSSVSHLLHMLKLRGHDATVSLLLDAQAVPGRSGSVQ